MARFRCPLKSTVLLVAHHGSKHSTGDAFLQKVQPEYSVIQVGKNNYGHPDDAVLQRLKKIGTNIFRNDTDGTIVFKTDGREISVTTQNGTNESTEQQEANGRDHAGNPDVAGPIRLNAELDNPSPSQNERVSVSVQVTDKHHQAVKGAKVALHLHYKSKDTIYEAFTDDMGMAVFEFSIGRAAKGFTVKGDLSAAINDQTAAGTIFSPEIKDG